MTWLLVRQPASLCALASAVLALAGGAARAEPEPQAEGASRHLALGLGLGKEYGFGGLLRMRENYVAVEAGGGAMPVIVMDANGVCGGAELDFAKHVGGGLLVFFNDEKSHFQNGLKLGAFYNSILRPGGWLGWHGEWSLSRVFALSLAAGLQVYPDGANATKERLAKKCPEGVQVEASGLTSVQPYASLNLLFYLF